MPGYPCCPSPIECGVCAAGTAPASYQLDVPINTWFPFGPLHCPSCDDYYGSFQLDWNPAAQLQSSGAQCAWSSPVFSACFGQTWSGETPVGGEHVLDFYYQYEIGFGRVLWLLQPDPPFEPLWHFEWHPDPTMFYDEDCGFTDFRWVHHSTHGGITGCGFNSTKILLLTAL